MSVNLYASNLIVNGSFEQPELTTTNWMTFYGQNGPGDACPAGNAPTHCSDTVLVPGWNAWWTESVLYGDEILPGRIEIQQGAIDGIAQFSGNQRAELDTHHRADSEDNNIVLFQFVNVCPNTAYTLDYAWKSRTTIENDNTMNVIVDDILLKTNVENNDWMMDHVSFVATEYLIPVAFFSMGESNTRGMLVDSVWLDADDPEAGACSACIFGKPNTLGMLYTATAGSDNTQADDYTTPDGVVDGDFPNPAWIEVYDDNGNKKQKLLASGSVAKGDTFIWNTDRVIGNGTKVKAGKVAPKTTIVIKDGEDGNIVQLVHFHTSCSQPLFVGDKFGAVTVWTVNQ